MSTRDIFGEKRLRAAVEFEQQEFDKIVRGDSPAMRSFFVEGEPVVKKRPRKGKCGFYTPSKSKEYERLVGLRAVEADVKPIDGPVSISINCYHKRPKKPTHKHPARSDLDNVIKAILDGLRGVAYKDDRHVVKIFAWKRYCLPLEEPGVEIEVRRAAV